MPSPSCYHCGLPCDPPVIGKVQQKERQFCCIGCLTVAQTIDEQGLGQFYQFRDKQSSKRSESQNQISFDAFDLAEVQQSFVENASSTQEAKLKTANIFVGGLHCAACVWLIEKAFEHESGVEKVAVNASQNAARIQFDPAHIKVSRLFEVFHTIGFDPQPLNSHANRRALEIEQKESLLRLGVAGLGMMQVGMAAIALHAGAFQGMELQWQTLLRWASLFITLPVILYSAKPFFTAAISALKMRSLIMDVPVSLALMLAFGASVYATVFQTGEVYFDSVTMFTFFLLLGRYFEKRLKTQNTVATLHVTQQIPATTLIDSRGSVTLHPTETVAVGQLMVVEPGATVACDAVVNEGTSEFNESMLTGESEPVLKNKGDALYAGSINGDSLVKAHVTATGADTCLAHISQLAQEAAFQKPNVVGVADKIASKFIAAVLLLTVGTFYVWAQTDLHRAFWVSLSVLVVTCPCALSLATPTVITAALAYFRKKQLLVTNVNVFDTLKHIDTVIFDKTGTLTAGRPQIKKVVMIEGAPVRDVDRALAIAAALEKHAKHPLAEAFRSIDGGLVVADFSVKTGMGVSGSIDDKVFRLGQPKYACGEYARPYPSPGLWLMLSQKMQDAFAWRPIAWIKLQDSLRDEAKPCVDALKALGKDVQIFSGDRLLNVSELAQQLGVENFTAQMLPSDKLAGLEKLQQQGKKVLVVGDGINDVPMLAKADAAFVMRTATDYAREQADVVIMSDDLQSVVGMLTASEKIQRVIKQNLTWALAYNITALPLAMLGLVPPWLAAIGMSASSLVVSVNALRSFRR